jgi:hypothetical protein
MEYDDTSFILHQQDFDRRRVPTRGLDDVLVSDELKAKLDKAGCEHREAWKCSATSVSVAFVTRTLFFHPCLTKTNGTTKCRWCSTRRHVLCSLGSGASAISVAPCASSAARQVCAVGIRPSVGRDFNSHRQHVCHRNDPATRLVRSVQLASPDRVSGCRHGQDSGSRSRWVRDRQASEGVAYTEAVALYAAHHHLHPHTLLWP